MSILKIMSNMDDSGESTENKTCLYPYQLRRIGAAATCKGIDDVFLLHKPKVTIGRHIAMVDIYLNSSVHKQLISRQHAVLTIEHHNNRQMAYIQDKSTNGTFINDIKIAGRVGIKEGDTLTFGHTSGVKLKPGMLSRQIYSEFRFVFERVLSENSPPTDELQVPSIFISRQTIATTNPLSRDQDLSSPGHDTAVLSDIAVVQKSNSENKIPQCSTPSRMPFIQQISILESSDTLTPTNFRTPQKFTSPTRQDDQTTATKSKQPTDFHLQSTSSIPVSSEMPCIADKNPPLITLPETLASRQFSTTLETSAIRKEKGPGEYISNKEVRSPESKDKYDLGISKEDERTASNLDDEIFQLTSAVSAKAKNFDLLASEQEFDSLSQKFQFGNQTFLAPKIAKTSSQTCWTSSTPCQGALFSASSDVHSSRSSSSVLSSQTPMRKTPSASDQEKVTSSLGDSISTEPPTTSPFQPAKKKKTMKDSEEVQSKKRGGQSSAEKAKKKSTKRHRRTSKTKTPPSVKQPLGLPNEVQMPDVEIEVCDALDCCKPTDSTLAWVQCDSCDSWYHVSCVGCDYDSIKKDSASFCCGCSK